MVFFILFLYDLLIWIFISQDIEEIKKFARDKWSVGVEQVEQCIKGWNYGRAEVRGNF